MKPSVRKMIAWTCICLVLVLFAAGCITQKEPGPANSSATLLQTTTATPSQAPSLISPIPAKVTNTIPATLPVPSPTTAAVGIHKIQHVIIIMQENRAFDEYFGTYPGANGIPMNDGVPSACVPDPASGLCVRPYHDPNDINYGGPHSQYESEADIDGGAMDGFIAQQELAVKNTCSSSQNPDQCTAELPSQDVMGYHNRSEIPNYWAYADNFVLQDRMFESSSSWSLPSHLFLVSAWVGKVRSRQSDELRRCTPGTGATCSRRDRVAGPHTGLCLDRYHVPALPEQCQLGLLPR